MGLNVNDIKFLLWAKKTGVDFTQAVTIGRQRLYLDVNSMQAVLAAFGIHEPKDKVEALFLDQKGYAEPFLKFLGAAKVDSIDASAYEGASNVLDMNQPIQEGLKGRFSVVIDGGSLEHVFNFPVAIRNCMEMVQPNGHFIGITPCNNYMGHGFYQFSPELFYRIFTEQNGFEVEKMILYETAPMTRWYEVIDPEQIAQRAEAHTWRHTLLIVLARKTAVKPLFTTTPQQSDYASIWRGSNAGGPPDTKPASPSTSQNIKRLIPFQLRCVYWKLREWARPKIKSEAIKEIRIGP
jgi:hypothetical protein